MSVPRKMKKEEAGMTTELINTNRLVIPISVILTSMISLGYVVWSASHERTKLHNRLDLQDTQIVRQDNNISDIKKSIERIEGFISGQNRGKTWTYQDQLVWCLKAQIKNPAWSCPGVSIEPPKSNDLD